MGTVRTKTGHNFVTLGNLIFDLQVDIGKGGAVGKDELLGALAVG